MFKITNLETLPLDDNLLHAPATPSGRFSVYSLLAFTEQKAIPTFSVYKLFRTLQSWPMIWFHGHWR